MVNKPDIFDQVYGAVTSVPDHIMHGIDEGLRWIDTNTSLYERLEPRVQQAAGYAAHVLQKTGDILDTMADKLYDYVDRGRYGK